MSDEKLKNESEKNIVFFIHKKQFTTNQTPLSASDILSRYAEEDPAETTLVLKIGNELTKYKDDQLIEMKNGMHFVVFHDGPTTVSFFGPERLLHDLRDLGYSVELTKAVDKNHYVVIRGYEIPLGRFKGMIVDIGLLATSNFPKSVGASIHVKSLPHLYDKSDSAPNVRNIIDSSLGPEWRYWSRNFNWNNQRQTAARLMAQIAGVFKDA